MSDMTLDSLVTELRDVFKTSLRAVVLYGAAAGDEAVPRDQLHTLVLVEDLPLERLEEGGAHLEAWVKAGHPPPLVLTIAEWRSSGDIFPVEYADILSRQRVLHGALPADGIRVDLAHLRLAAEREAMGALLQLRRGVLAAGGDPARRAELLAASLGTFVTIFRSTLRVHGLRPPTDAADVCRELGFRAQLDTEPFLRVLTHRRGGQRLPAHAVHDVLAGFLAGVEQLVAHLDRVRPAEGPVS
jgi:hypothetical protein